MQDTSRIFDGKLLDGASKTRKIPLNLVYDYPVRWSKYKVLRDFVQNFYDSIGYRAWNSRFKYRYKSGKLSMKGQDVSFSYEWLVPIRSIDKERRLKCVRRLLWRSLFPAFPGHASSPAQPLSATSPARA